MSTELCNIARTVKTSGTFSHTDKVQHGYTLYYYKYLHHLRNKAINMLELGIRGGPSILMWHKFFTKGTIYCIDNDAERSCPFDTLNSYPRIQASFCFQEDKNCLDKLYKNIEFDFINDDASHFQKETLISLAHLFKKLKPGGIYIVEDMCPIWGFQTGSAWGIKNNMEKSWFDTFKKTGKLPDKELFKDCFAYVFDKFQETGKFYSEYLTDEENNYLTKHIQILDIQISGPRQRQKIYHAAGVPIFNDFTPNTSLNAGSLYILKKK